MIDLDAAFFDTDGFAVVVTYGAASFRAIIDRPHAEAQGIAGEAITLTVDMASLPDGANAAGAEFSVGDETFVCKGVARESIDNRIGVFECELGETLGEIQIDGESTYMLLGEPTANKSAEETWQISSFVSNRGLLRFDLSGLPDRDVVSAEVTAVCQSRTGLVSDIEAYNSEQAIVIAEATWLEYASGQSWESSGASDIPGDRTIPALGDGLGSGLTAEESFVLVTGDVARDWVNAHRAAGAAALVIDIEQGQVNFYGALSETPPKLIVRY